MPRPLAIAPALVLAIAPAARGQYIPNFADEWDPDPDAKVDEFGISLARSGEWAVVGAPTNPAGGLRPGSAYVYRLVGGAWQRFTELTASDGQPGDAFGIDVAIDGGTVVVGASGHDHGTGPGTGAAYVFTLNGSAWTECVELQGTGVSAPAEVGFARQVSISGDTIVLGAPFTEPAGSTPHLNHGAVYLYCKPAGGWCPPPSNPMFETRKLLLSNPSPGAKLGDDVVIDGSVVVAGATAENSSTGAVYVFEEPAEGWCGGTAVVNETARILSEAPAMGDQFGIRIDLFERVGETDLVAIGAWSRDERGINSGAAYAVDEPAGGWSSVTLPIPASPNLLQGQLTTDDAYGVGVSIDPTNPDRIVVGAPKDDPHPGTDWGRAFVFERQGSSWVNTHWLQTEETTAGGQFTASTGTSVAIEGDSVLVGAIHDENPSGTDAGAVFVFDLTDHDRRVYCFCDAAPCNNPDPTGGCANVGGSGAQLVPTGSTSVVADDLRLTAYGVVANNAGIFFMGPVPTANPIQSGNGWRCIGPGSLGLFRYPIQFPTSTTTPAIALGPGIVGLSHSRFTHNGQIQAGQSWCFQAWYRDPNGACGASFDFSNAIEVQFGP